MADDRAEPLRDPEAERYLMGIINNEIPYVRAQNMSKKRM